MLNSYGQRNLDYSGFFDSYYTRGPLTYTFEPGLTYFVGDLENAKMGIGIGAGVNYQIWPAVFAQGSFRYLTFGAEDHVSERGISYSGSTMQLNFLGNYHIIFDKVRNQSERRKGGKRANLYVGTGLSFNRYTANSVTSSDSLDLDINGKNTLGVHFPLVVGVPIKINPKWQIIPELGYAFTLSDALDGVDERSTTSNNDGYVTFSLKVLFDPSGKVKKKIRFSSATKGGGGGGSNADSNNYSDPGNNDEKLDDEEDIYEDPNEDDNQEDIYDEENLEDDNEEEDDGFLEDDDFEDSGDDGEEDNSDDSDDDWGDDGEGWD